ncbi:MAG: hypothetical protein ACYTF1_13440, partial [Planctomycetota bacterium]
MNSTSTSKPSSDIQPTGDREPVGWVTIFLVVAFFVLAGHIWSIDSGLWLDDHAHYEHLHNLDWSFASAVEASRLGIVGDVLDLWGRHEAGLRFFRPIAFWIMKIEYTIGRWNPMVMDLFSLGWHFLCSMLVVAAALRCFGRRSWAMAAGAMMAILPTHTATVYWIACQTELVTTAFLLIGILAYARHAGWSKATFVRGNDSGWYGRADGWHGQAKLDRGINANNPHSHQPTITLYSIIAIICYALAIGCRENAVLFPVVCWMGDRLFGSTRRKKIRAEHWAMLGVLVVYMVLRYIMLGGFPLPQKPYLMPITDPQFPMFVVEKTVMYTLGLFGCVPVIPIGGRVFFASRPGVFYGGFALVIVVLLIIWSVYRFRKSLLWPVVWIACFLAPVMPVFASGHHLYLPCLGMVLLITAGLAAIGGILRPADYCLPPWRRWIRNSLLTVLALAAITATWCSGFAYVRGTLAEDILIEEITRESRPIAEGDHLFFINLPPVCYYVVPALRAELGIDELHGHALTCAPDLVRMTTPGQVDVLDKHTLRVRSAPDQHYFEGITGRTLLQMMGFEGMPVQGQAIDAGLFSVTPTAVDQQGVGQLVFKFKAPLNSPNYHF